MSKPGLQINEVLFCVPEFVLLLQACASEYIRLLFMVLFSLSRFCDTL